MIDDSNTFTIRRIFQAPRELVFDAWTKPEHLEKWWKCDPAWSTSQVAVDFRVGGQWRLGMVNPENKQEYVCFGQFREIDSPRRVVYTWQWEPPGMEHETLVTVEFNEQENATELV
ncbi:MAG: SRPBCC domain-containing protein, partial [bacterium]|nr:SRPBCC domain-containing protein [bacterium]